MTADPQVTPESGDPRYERNPVVLLEVPSESTRRVDQNEKREGYFHIPSLQAAEHPVFLEKSGIVMMEAESTASRLGKWKLKISVHGFSGSGHLEFTGNKPESGPPDSPLIYRFSVSKAGN